MKTENLPSHLHIDFVQGPALVHYDSLRAFSPRRDCKIQTVVKGTHSLSQKNQPKVETCEQV